MKNTNLNLALGLAAALFFSGVPSAAGDNPVLASNLGLDQAEALATPGLSPSAGIGHPAKGWLAKALPLAALDADLKKAGAVSAKPAQPRKRRISRLQDPGEAMGGGDERRILADARRMEALAAADSAQ